MGKNGNDMNGIDYIKNKRFRMILDDILTTKRGDDIDHSNQEEIDDIENNINNNGGKLDIDKDIIGDIDDLLTTKGADIDDNEDKIDDIENNMNDDKGNGDIDED